MTTESRPDAPPESEQAFRERMRAHAMRPVMIWVLDPEPPDADDSARLLKPYVEEPDRDGDELRAFRERMREEGRSQVEIWVPDPDAPHFAAEMRRQARLLANSPHAEDDMAFVESISDFI